MKFRDFIYELKILPMGAVHVLVKADLIHFFWGEGAGQPSEGGIVAANRSAIDEIAMSKLSGRQVEGRIVVSAVDLEAAA